MSNFENDHDVFASGIDKLLGKQEYDKPEVVKECTQHQSDGFIYDDEPNPIETILRCKVCGEHYTVPSSSINFTLLKSE